jgi:hypothetical protein
MTLRWFGARLNPDYLMPIRFFRLDPLRIRRQRNSDGENNGFLHAQVSTDSCIAPKSRAANSICGIRPGTPILRPAEIPSIYACRG